MAFFGMAVMIGPAVGPTLGGYIVDHYAWPWIFYINLPVGLLGLFMVSRFVQEPEDIRMANRAMAAKQRSHFDWQGIALLAVGLASLQYLLEEGQRDDWFQSSTIVTFALIALFCLAGFVIRELYAKVPVVNLRLFQDRVFNRYADRRHDVRHADGQYVLVASIHAGTAGFHGDAVRDGANAASHRNDARNADRGKALQSSLAARLRRHWRAVLYRGRHSDE